MMQFKTAKGFTLIELVAVVFIAGIIVSAVVLNVSLVKPHKQLNVSTDNLIKLIKYAQQQALFSNQHHALSLTKTGYVFLKYQGDSWVRIEKKPLLSKKRPEQIQLELLIEDKLVAPLKKDKLEPHILLLSSGEVSPFELRFIDKENDYSIKLNGSLTGEVKKQVFSDEDE